MLARDDEVREAAVADFLLAGLRIAKAGLRRRSIDELEDFLGCCFHVPREMWPAEVTQFIDRRLLPRNKMRARVHHFVEWTKREVGPMRSKQADLDRFYGNPNRVAAHLAAIYIAESRRRPGKVRSYKERPGGPLITKDAVDRAAAVVDSSLRHAGRRQRVNVDIVKELLRRGRTRRPHAD